MGIPAAGQDTDGFAISGEVLQVLRKGAARARRVLVIHDEEVERRGTLRYSASTEALAHARQTLELLPRLHPQEPPTPRPRANGLWRWAGLTQGRSLSCLGLQHDSGGVSRIAWNRVVLGCGCIAVDPERWSRGVGSHLK